MQFYTGEGEGEEKANQAKVHKKKWGWGPDVNKELIILEQWQHDQGKGPPRVFGGVQEE